MAITTISLTQHIDTLDTAFNHLQRHGPHDTLYNIFRAASVKEFELVLELSGSLLKKRLRPYLASNRQADRLTFKNAFRHAAKHGLISVEASERWLSYRDNRNDTAHDYGEAFAETTLKLLPNFLVDARELASVIAEDGDD